MRICHFNEYLRDDAKEKGWDNVREIKYRAWLKEEERIVSVSHISFIGEEIDVYEGDSSSGDWRPFNEIILMQYTGFKDSDGKEIYEGDIVSCLGHDDEDIYDSLVYYSGGALCIDSSGCDYDYIAIGWALESDLFSIEVIGNIYENPELVKDA